MKILITSDSHGHIDLYGKIKKRHPDIKIFLDAGDSEASQQDLSPFITVKGNCDHFYEMLDKLVIPTPYGKLLMKHTPYISTKELIDENIKIFVYGHLHKRDFHKNGDIYYISPGSIAYERDNNKEGYVILNIEKDNVTAEFFDL